MPVSDRFLTRAAWSRLGRRLVSPLDVWLIQMTKSPLTQDPTRRDGRRIFLRRDITLYLNVPALGFSQACMSPRHAVIVDLIIGAKFLFTLCAGKTQSDTTARIFCFASYSVSCLPWNVASLAAEATAHRFLQGL